MEKRDEIWCEYRDKFLEEFFWSISLEEFKSFEDWKRVKDEKDNCVERLLSADTIKVCTKILREYVNEKPINKLKERFRSYKYRKQNKKKTLVVNATTHQKLDDFCTLSHADTVDEGIDILLSIDYSDTEMVEALCKHGDIIYDEQPSIASLIQRISKRDRATIVAALEQAFRIGWQKAKRSRSKKANALDVAMHEYIKENT